MSKKTPEFTQAPREKTFLVGVDIFQQKTLLPLEDSLTELALLADTSGLEVIGELTQKLDRPHVKTYIGPGKVEELKMLAEETLAEVVIFDDELSAAQSRNLEKMFNCKVLDRTSLIGCAVSIAAVAARAITSGVMGDADKIASAFGTRIGVGAMRRDATDAPAANWSGRIPMPTRFERWIRS